MTPIDPKRIEILDPMVAEIYRAKPPHVRVDQAFASGRFVRSVILSGIRDRHPDWAEEQVQGEVARRILRGTD